ncbi:PREDICTED: kelch-like protein 24 [Nestor notabilis]|uniref:kelch-like protein 24 n=1 Tax=Nestor notabilis TaxID=176057 RepID=UPI0005238B3A|nr:PREDICTED: kelch-like protein 24 [Nestor notabilis]
MSKGCVKAELILTAWQSRSMEPAQEPEELGPQTETVADTVLEVGGSLFQVSRRALSIHSRYFEAMFFGGARESSEHHIVIRGIDAVPFQALLEFTSTAQVLIEQENVTSLLETADFFQFDRVKLLCEKFLERELHVSNCLGLMTYSQQFAFIELYASAMNVALSHWGEVMCQEEFKALPKEMLLRLLQSDDLFVSREDVVFDSVMRWIVEDPATREEDFLDLVGHVRVTFLSLSFLDFLVKRSKCSGEADAFSRLIKKLDRSPPPSWQNTELYPHAGRSYDTLYVLGGKHDKDQQELFLFHPKTGTWQACSPLQRRNLTQYAVAAVGSFLFVTGGYFRDEFVWYSVDWVLTYNCLDNSWLEGPAMKKSRNSHCAVGAGLYLYVLGGSTDEGIIPAVERMALVDSEWESMSPMAQPVERGDAVSMGTRIYVVCGLDENGHVYDGVQRLNTETDSWDVISFSPLPRYDLCITSLNGALYTIGGGAFRFDVETDEWTQVDEECLTHKFFMGCSTVNGRIYLLGQRKGNGALPIVVLFDPYTDTCQVIDNKLPCPLPINGCVSVRRFDTWA